MRIARLHTADLPAGQRFEAWLAFAAHSHGGVALDSPHRNDFAATIDAHDFGTIRMSNLSNSPSTAMSSASMVRASGSEIILVTHVHRGKLIVNRNGVEVTVEAGSLVAFDWARPMSAANPTDIASTVLELPIAAVGLRRTQLEPFMAKPMATDSGIGGLLAYIMGDLYRNGDTYEPALLAHLTSSFVDLLGTGARYANGARSTPSRSRLQRNQIYSYIEQALTEPTLTPAAIAFAQGLSIRQLNRILREDGTSPADYIRRRRLAGCRRDLVDPDKVHWSVSTIGSRWGFPDPAAFSRAFRNAYGMPPGEYRKRFNRAA